MLVSGGDISQTPMPSATMISAAHGEEAADAAERGEEAEDQQRDAVRRDMGEAEVEERRRRRCRPARRARAA